MNNQDPFKYNEKDLYELALKKSKKRFGSMCLHLKIKNGVCINCFRKVINSLNNHNK